MIKNEREYRITKAQAKEFENALAQITAAPPPADLHPVLAQAEEDALRSQLEDLLEQLHEYEGLRAGQQSIIELDSFDELPRALIQARIARGLSQKELAEKLGLKEQQIQRYEATNYAAASLSRIKQVIDALGVTIQKDVFIPSKEMTIKNFYARARQLGLDRELLLNRLLPAQTAAGLRELEQFDLGDTAALHTAAATVDHVLDWQPGTFFTAQVPAAAPALAARFKLPARAGKSFAVYVAYAHHLARAVLHATLERPYELPPADPAQLREAIITRYGELTLASTLRYAWDLGIPVLPLQDHGAFHGACWRENYRSVIVLKQRTPSLARWLHDLLHELRHVTQHPEDPAYTVIEPSENPFDRRHSPEEIQAMQFASSVIFAGQEEKLAARCAEEAQGSVERLKAVVPQVAAAAGVDTGALANYIAFRLALTNRINWWGAATNLQPRGENPWEIARTIFCERMDFGPLPVLDRELINQALRPELP